ncbi:MAG: hypothetical protein PWQ98_471 [Moorella sp. (in: firmicutes)]|nr:hypothetical protein [Moorella sp. (in: firmicutes)]
MVFPNPCVFFSQLKMVKLHHFHITVQEYHRRGKENLFPELYGCPNPCCCYEGRLRRHGFFYRNALTLTASYVIVIQRYYCPACKKTVSLLPSFLAPRFQYSLACIFYVLYQRLVNHLPMAHIALKVNMTSNRAEMAYQHVCFYCNRLLENRPLITGFWGSEGVVLAASDPASWARAFITTLSSSYHLEPFSLLYFAFQARHFLSKS